MRKIIQCSVLLFCALSTDGTTTTITGEVFCTDQCLGTGIRCKDTTTYQLCMNLTDYAVSLSDAKKCPDGAICDTSGSFACKIPSITTTTIAPVTTTLPACSGPDAYPTSSCTTYYLCVQVLWWYEPRVQTCPDGENFDPDALECSATYSCNIVTTTAPNTTPTCSWWGNLPGPTPNQYYECTLVWFVFEAQLKTCPDGQYFDESLGQCDAGTENTTVIAA